MRGGAEQHGIREAGIQAAIKIGNLFGQRGRMPVAINLAALIPHRSDNADILLSFRSTTFEGTLLTAKSHLKLTYEDDERANCSSRKTKIVACDLLPEVQECRMMMRAVYKDYCVRTLRGKSPLLIFPLPLDMHFLMQNLIDYIGYAVFLLRRSVIFKLKEDLEAEDPTPSSRDMTSVDATYNHVLRQLDTITRLCEDLHGGLAHRAEGSIAGAESEGGVESFD